MFVSHQQYRLAECIASRSCAFVTPPAFLATPSPTITASHRIASHRIEIYSGQQLDFRAHNSYLIRINFDHRYRARFVIRYSLFVIRYSLFVIRYSLPGIADYLIVFKQLCLALLLKTQSNQMQLLILITEWPRHVQTSQTPRIR